MKWMAWKNHAHPMCIVPQWWVNSCDERLEERNAKIQQCLLHVGCMNTNLLTIKITSLSLRIAALLVSSCIICLRPSWTARADGTLSYRYLPWHQKGSCACTFVCARVRVYVFVCACVRMCACVCKCVCKQFSLVCKRFKHATLMLIMHN